MPDLAIRERLLAAMQVRLADRLRPEGDGQAAVPLRRNLGAPQTETLAVDQYDGGHDVTIDSTTRESLFTLAVELELFAPDGPQLNELYARVRDAVETDRTFGGLANDARERGLSAPVPGTTEGHPDVLGAVLTLEVEFWTRDDNVRAQV